MQPEVLAQNDKEIYNQGYKDGLELGLIYAEKKHEYSRLLHSQLFHGNVPEEETKRLDILGTWIKAFEKQYK